VHALIDETTPGRALDAACGTGRHARKLADAGHEVVGVDVSPEMLERARAGLPQATFHEGDLRALDEPDASFDLVVCGLALAHLPDVGAGVAELARVLRPGGRLVVSVLHPFQAQLGWHAPFTGADGRRGFVREHPHTHAGYLAAFRASGLELRDCAEPLLTADEVRTKRRAYEHVPEATVAAYLGLPGVLVWAAEKPC
jgi:SAM-dependent methyltransferase